MTPYGPYWSFMKKNSGNIKSICSFFGIFENIQNKGINQTLHLKRRRGNIFSIDDGLKCCHKVIRRIKEWWWNVFYYRDDKSQSNQSDNKKFDIRKSDNKVIEGRVPTSHPKQ